MTKRSIEKEMQNAAIASSNPTGALCLGQAIKVGTACALATVIPSGTGSITIFLLFYSPLL